MKKGNTGKEQRHWFSFWIFILFLAPQAFASPQFHPFDENLPEELHNLWNAVVRLEVQPVNGSPHESKRGSGFIIHHDTARDSLWIAANYHTTYCNIKDICTVEVTYSNTTKRFMTSSNSIYKQIAPESDLMVLNIPLKGGEDFSVATFSTEHISYNDPVYTIGFPSMISSGRKSRRSSNSNRSRKRYSVGTIYGNLIDHEQKNYPIQRNRTVTLYFSKLISHSAPFLKGSSGGPLVNPKGEVIGINSSMSRSKECKPHISSENCLFFSIPIEILLNRLPPSFYERH